MSEYGVENNTFLNCAINLLKKNTNRNKEMIIFVRLKRTNERTFSYLLTYRIFWDFNTNFHYNLQKCNIRNLFYRQSFQQMVLGCLWNDWNIAVRRYLYLC